MRVFLGEVRWEEALESAQRALQADDTNADALAMLALSSAAKDGRLHVAARYLGESSNCADSSAWLCIGHRPVPGSRSNIPLPFCRRLARGVADS